MRVVHIPATGQRGSQSIVEGLVPRPRKEALYSGPAPVEAPAALPGVRDGCMSCFVRGAHGCPVHKDKPLDFVAAEALAERESPADRVDVYAIPDEPLPGWDLVRTPAKLARDLNWGQYRYVRDDGFAIFLSKSQEGGVYGEWWWRPDHPVLGALFEHAAKDPQKLMRWADLMVPLIPQEDPASIRARGRRQAIQELGRCRS